MLSNFREIAKSLKVKKGIDQELMESISKFVFQKTYEEMSNMTDLIINIEGFCTFFYSRKRLLQLKLKIEGLLSDRDVSINNKKIRVQYLKDMSKEEMEILLVKVNNLLNRYDEYIAEKTDLKDKRTAYKEGKG
jgi:predicted house-cleaning noncanonical NTP pyrophosphatase (MazG superfamily)